MNKILYIVAYIVAFCYLQASAQSISNSTLPNLSQTVIVDFTKAVNYSWDYSNNSDAFKAALIPGLQRRGIYSQPDIIRTIQDIGKNKVSRDLVLRALFEYTGSVRFKQILLSMDIPNSSVNLLSSYANRLILIDNSQLGEFLHSKKMYTVIVESAELKKMPQYSSSWITDRYCVYGNQVEAVKVYQGFLYCEFRDDKAKKVISGWIDTNLLVESSLRKELQNKKTSSSTAFNSLLDLDGLNSDQDYYDGQGVFFKRKIVVSELRKILSEDYDNFNTNFLQKCTNGNIEIKYKVLYLHVSTFNPKVHVSLIIDVLNHRSYLCQITYGRYNEKAESKYYGLEPISTNVITFIKTKIKQKTDEGNNGSFEEEKQEANNEAQLLQEFLTKYPIQN